MFNERIFLTNLKQGVCNWVMETTVRKICWRAKLGLRTEVMSRLR